jgi:hypothetical protein
MMSVVAVANAPVFSSYNVQSGAFILNARCASRIASHDTQVIGVFPGPVDTDMAEGVPMAKTAPIAVAKATLEAVEQGFDDMYSDPVSQNVFAAIAEPLKAVEKQFAGWMPQQSNRCVTALHDQPSRHNSYAFEDYTTSQSQVTNVE